MEKLSHDECVEIVRGETKYHIYNYLRNKLAEIRQFVNDAAYVLEDLYYLSFIWGVVESELGDNCYEFESIEKIPVYQKMIYDRSKKKEVSEAFQRESETGKKEKYELERVRKESSRKEELLRIIRDFTNDINEKSDFSKCNDYKQRALDDVANLGLDDDESKIAEEILSLFSAAIEKNIVSSSDYKTDLAAVESRIDQKTVRLKKKYCAGFNVSEAEFNRKMQEVRVFLTTGEVLYKQYIENCETASLSDYGGIALEYYRAIEFLLNELLYRPYRTVVLKEIGINGNITKYFGHTNGNNPFVYKNKPKESLEYGTISKFLYDVSDRNSDLAFAKKFFISKGIDMQKLNYYSQKLWQTKEGRNNCAHPHINTMEDVRNARIWTYYKEPQAIKDVKEIRELVFELETIFK